MAKISEQVKKVIREEIQSVLKIELPEKKICNMCAKNDSAQYCTGAQRPHECPLDQALGSGRGVPEVICNCCEGQYLDCCDAS